MSNEQAQQASSEWAGENPSGLPVVTHIAEEWLDPGLIESIPVDWARRNIVLPIRWNGALAVITASSHALQVFEDVALLLGEDPQWLLAPEKEIQRAIDQCYFQHADHTSRFLKHSEEESQDVDNSSAGFRSGSDDLLSAGAGTPVAHLVNLILLEAVKRGASDIHIEPFAKSLVVRYRIDGLLYEQPSPPRHLEASLVARLKVMAHLDLAEKRLPQDGTARVRVGEREIDIRVSTLPVAEGERIVLRLLYRESTDFSLAELGMPPALFDQFKAVLKEPNGIVLVTGPTGSGKTTTLYAALRELDTERLNVLTIEDPIEYQLPGIGQMQVHPKIDLTFSRGLRHILRQDPDVVLVGETRDLETAEIVVRASLTGHLVFTTLHTNDAPGAVIRMADMGIPSYLLASAIRAVLAQRLVRKLCPKCKKASTLSAADVGILGDGGTRLIGHPVWRAVGCADCLGGYKGRMGIYELWMATPDLREAIRNASSLRDLREQAAQAGFRSLLDDGLDKVLLGETSIEEVLRTAGHGD